MEQPTQTPQEPADSSPTLAQPVQTLSPVETKRRLARKLALIGVICLTAPLWGVLLFMAASDSAGSSSGAGSILPSLVGYAIGLAPIPGIGLLIASLVVRNQAKKLAATTQPPGDQNPPLQP